MGTLAELVEQSEGSLTSCYSYLSQCRAMLQSCKELELQEVPPLSPHTPTTPPSQEVESSINNTDMYDPFEIEEKAPNKKIRTS